MLVESVWFKYFILVVFCNSCLFEGVLIDVLLDLWYLVFFGDIIWFVIFKFKVLEIRFRLVSLFVLLGKWFMNSCFILKEFVWIDDKKNYIVYIRMLWNILKIEKVKSISK